MVGTDATSWTSKNSERKPKRKGLVSWSTSTGKEDIMGVRGKGLPWA